MKDQPLIELRNVWKRFGGNEVLRGVNLAIHAGKITSIIGKSGGGKSVLLKHVIGLLQPDSGDIFYNGRPFSAMSKSELRKLKKKFSYMFQGNALFDSMVVFDNIALPLRERDRLSAEEVDQRVSRIMAQLDIREIGAKYPSQISGGMQKRVALARALVTEPEIVLFDEPTTGLDPVRKNVVHTMISDYQTRFGFTGIVISHEIPDIFFISQRVAMLDEGRIIYEGSPEGIQDARDPSVHRFVQGFEAHEDALTGMESQSYGEKRFQEELSRLQRHRIPFSVLLLSVQNLNEVYDAIGHQLGHTALQRFAATVRGNLRITDICSRTALNRIMVVLPNTDLEQTWNICKKLSRAIDFKDIVGESADADVCLAISAGTAEASENSRLDEVIAAAESKQTTFCQFKIC